MGADSGHHYCTHAGDGEGGRPDDHAGKNFSANRRRTRPDRAGEGDGSRKLGSPDFCVFRPFQATHSSFPPFFNPLNSFPWSFSPDSSPFERYGKNKFGRLLDRVFRPPQQPLDQGESTDVFLVSWAFH